MGLGLLTIVYTTLIVCNRTLHCRLFYQEQKLYGFFFFFSEETTHRSTEAQVLVPHRVLRKIAQRKAGCPREPELRDAPWLLCCCTRGQELYDCINEFFVSSTMSEKKKGARLRLESRSSGDYWQDLSTYYIWLICA